MNVRIFLKSHFRARVIRTLSMEEDTRAMHVIF